MQPTPEPTPAASPSAPASAPVVADQLVEFVRADRQRAAYIMLGIGAVLLALCAWTAITAYKTPPAPPEKKKAEEQPPAEDELSKPKVKNPSQEEYLVGALLAAAACLAAVGVGGWLLVSPPPQDEGRQRTDARTAILCAGGALGEILMLAGAVYFYLWDRSLSEWLDKGQDKQAKFVIAPLLAVGLGGLMMFLAVQPARAEERSNRTLRRLIYGANLQLSVLLLFVALIVLNIVVGSRLPNKLDVTQEGFYSLSEGSVEFLRKLPEPVKAYVILSSERRGAEDIRRLMQNAQDRSGGRFTAEFISPVSNVSKFQELKGKYPVVDSNELGVLLTVGEDEKRHSFIRDDEFIQTERGPPMSQQPPTTTFVGESRLMREMLFLAEGDKKAVVYFTQSSGEMDIDGTSGGDGPTGRLLKEYLTRNYLDVRPLRFEGPAPKVPDDAAVVIVAEPRFTMPKEHVEALRQYMTEPRGTKKGKLIVLVGAQFGPKNEVLSTGLEGLLLEFNTRLDNRLILSDPTPELPAAALTVAGFTDTAIKTAKNPVAVSLGKKTAFIGELWRPVAPLAQGGPAYTAIPLLGTMPGRRSWLETQLPKGSELPRILADVFTKPEVAGAKQLTGGSRSVGVAVSEGEAGRLVVVGNGFMVSDQMAQAAGGEPDAFGLVGGSVDWLRDRPPLTIQIDPKKYQVFKFPITADKFRGQWLPLLLAVVIVTGLGVSVWVMRRRS
jgi:hypothetical protein